MTARSWVIVIGCCIAATFALAAIKYSQIQTAIAFGKSFPEPLETVELALAAKSIWQPEVSATAELVATRSVELSNELAGRITHVGFAPGEQVKAQQILLRLDTSEEEAQLAATKADAKLAKLALDRNRKLVKSGVASAEEMDRAEAQYSSANAQVSALQAVINKKTITAPFAATAGLHELEVGQYLTSGTIITRLVGLSDSVWVDFNLPQHQAILNIGDNITLQASQVLEYTSTAKIVAKDAWVDTNSRNVRYRAVTDNSESKLMPGTIVTVKIPLGEPQQVILIPATAVRFDSFGANTYVLIPSEKGAAAKERASKRPITLGPERNQMVVITSGLRAGERVAANGSFKLREGILVNAVKPRIAVATEAPESSLLVPEI
ncbi:MAG: efflux RND transporter periplasmic adaptor subunit [Pseudomonadales bacterium]